MISKMSRNKKLQSLELKDLDYFNKMLLDCFKIFLMLRNVLSTSLRKMCPMFKKMLSDFQRISLNINSLFLWVIHFNQEVFKFQYSV